MIEGKKIKLQELLIYELPSWVEFCSNGFLKNCIAWYYAKKVGKKWRRYQNRLFRIQYLKEKGFIK